MTKETKVIFTDAAKAVFTAQAANISTALNNTLNAKDIQSSAAQVMALTAYQAFEVNGCTIPSKDISSYLGLSDAEDKKLKQYVSRAAFVWGYKGKTYNFESQEITTPHSEFMTDNAPSITSTYKAIKAHEKLVKQAYDAAVAAKAMELKAAQAYMDSDLPAIAGVSTAEELLTYARANNDAMLANGNTQICSDALSKGSDIVEADFAESVAETKAIELLEQGQAILEALYELNSDMANDALVALHSQIESLSEQHAAQVAAIAA